MSRLLDEVLTAHGGLERWRAVTALTAHGRFGGLLRSRFPENRMANVTVRVQLAEQHAVFHGFPQEDQQAVFDRGDVRIETRDGELIKSRSNARAAFAGLSGLRRNLRWGGSRCRVLRRICMVELPLDAYPSSARRGHPHRG